MTNENDEAWCWHCDCGWRDCPCTLSRRVKVGDDFPDGSPAACAAAVKPPPAVVAGVGPDAPVVANAAGGLQSRCDHRCDLLPARATLAVAKVLHGGAARYGDDNWRAIEVRDHLNHALVHVLALLAGDAQDDHLAHAATRLLFALDLELVAKGAK